MSKVGIRPLGEKVLVKRLEAEDRTAGGIVLPDTAKEKPQIGEVVAAQSLRRFRGFGTFRGDGT